MSRILLLVFVFCFAACEGTTPTTFRLLHSGASAITPPRVQLSLTRGIRLPPPPKGAATADIDFGILYAQNGIAFVDSLVDQFEDNIIDAASDGYLTLNEGEQILRRVARQQRILNRAFNNYISKLNKRRSLNAPFNKQGLIRSFRATTIRFRSPYGPPIRRIPGFQKTARLQSLRTMIGQMESFSGLAIAFIQSLTDQITETATASQITLAKRIETKLLKGLRKDIRGIRSLINLINTRRFKRSNKGKIDPAAFVGEYTGTCTNITNGAIESIGATIDFDADSNTILLSFNRPSNIFGSGSPEAFSDTFSRRSGLRFDQDLEKFGAISVTMSPKGFIKGLIITDPVASVDRVDFWGIAKKSDGTLAIDLRIDFESLSEGGQAHAVLELSRS